MIIKPKIFPELIKNSIIRNFTEFLNYHISSMTPLKYKPSVIKMDGSLTLHLKNDKIFNIDPMKVIRDSCKNIDFNSQKNQIKYLFRTISQFTNINELYEIRNVASGEFSNLEFPDFKYESVKVKVRKFKDGSIVNQLIDPYQKYYGIFVDFSKPFEYFDYGYNYLHVFEHMMCSNWKNKTQPDNITMNGFTSLVGISMAYSIDKTEKTFKQKLKNEIKLWFESRTEEFWKKHRKELDVEIKRTYSETFETKSLHDYFRTQPDVFNENCEIYQFFASSPIKLLLISPNDFNFDFSIIEKFSKEFKPIKNKPFCPVFDYFPVSVLNDKLKSQYRIEKMTKTDLTDLLNGNGRDYYGIDVKFVSKKYSAETSILYPLIIFSEEIDLKEYVKKLFIPNNLKLFKDQPIVFL